MTSGWANCDPIRSKEPASLGLPNQRRALDRTLAPKDDIAGLKEVLRKAPLHGVGDQGCVFGNAKVALTNFANRDDRHTVEFRVFARFQQGAERPSLHCAELSNGLLNPVGRQLARVLRPEIDCLAYALIRKG